MRWEVAEDELFARGRAERDDRRAAGARAQRPRRGGGPPARALVLLPLHRRRRGESRRPHPHGARARRAPRPAALRARLVPALRARLLRRLPAPRRRRPGPRGVRGRLHLRGAGRRGQRARARGRRGADAAGLPQPPRPVQDRPRPPAAPRRGAVARDLGRPRGGQRLRGPAVGVARPGVPRAPRRGVPGLLRAHAAARARPPGDGGMVLRSRHDAGALARFHVLDGRQHRTPQACPRPGRGGSEPHRRELPRAHRARPDDAGRRAGGLAGARPRDRPGALALHRPADAHGPGGHGRGGAPARLLRRLGRLSRRPRPPPRRGRRGRPAELRRAHRRHPHELRVRPQAGLRRPAGAGRGHGARRHLDHDAGARAEHHGHRRAREPAHPARRQLPPRLHAGRGHAGALHRAPAGRRRRDGPRDARLHGGDVRRRRRAPRARSGCSAHVTPPARPPPPGARSAGRSVRRWWRPASRPTAGGEGARRPRRIAASWRWWSR